MSAGDAGGETMGLRQDDIRDLGDWIEYWSDYTPRAELDAEAASRIRERARREEYKDLTDPKIMERARQYGLTETVGAIHTAREAAGLDRTPRVKVRVRPRGAGRFDWRHEDGTALGGRSNARVTLTPDMRVLMHAPGRSGDVTAQLDADAVKVAITDDGTPIWGACGEVAPGHMLTRWTLETEHGAVQMARLTSPEGDVSIGIAGPGIEGPGRGYGAERASDDLLTLAFALSGEREPGWFTHAPIRPRMDDPAGNAALDALDTLLAEGDDRAMEEAVHALVALEREQCTGNTPGHTGPETPWIGALRAREGEDEQRKILTRVVRYAIECDQTRDIRLGEVRTGNLIESTCAALERYRAKRRTAMSADGGLVDAASGKPALAMALAEAAALPEATRAQIIEETRARSHFYEGGALATEGEVRTARERQPVAAKLFGIPRDELVIAERALATPRHGLGESGEALRDAVLGRFGKERTQALEALGKAARTLLVDYAANMESHHGGWRATLVDALARHAKGERLDSRAIEEAMGRSRSAKVHEALEGIKRRTQGLRPSAVRLMRQAAGLQA